MLNRLSFSLKMFFHPNKIYIRTLKKNWLNNFIAFVAFGCGLVSILAPFIQEIKIPYYSLLIIILGVLIVFSFLSSIPNCYKRFKIVGTGGNAIELVIGNMLTDSNDMVIPSNNYFDTSWSVISRKSIQGQLADKKYYGLTRLDRAIQEAIEHANLKGDYNESKNVGNKTRYPIHSIITIQDNHSVDSQKYYWIAISNFSNDGDIITEEIDVHESINALWKYLATHVRVRNLCIPVLGTGLTPTSVPQFDVIEFIVDSFLAQLTKSKIVDTLRIYLFDKGEDTYSTFHLASQYIEHRIQNLSATELKHKF